MTSDDARPRPRLADVAAVAGVSQKTVSNVVNGFHQVSDRTRTAVLAAIEETGYRPNLSARNLARGRTGTIALVVPRLEMPYFAALAGRILAGAAARDLFVLIHETGSEREAELDALEGRFPQRMDGIVLAAENLTVDDLGARADDTPLVLLGTGPSIPGVPRVALDDEEAARAAVGHLIAQGCTRIAMVGAHADDVRNPRLVGCRRALEEAGLALDPVLAVPIRGNVGEEGERAVEQMLASADAPDGLFAVTDWVALGAMRALQRHGLAVPEDVAVIGFDDIPYGRVATPSLSTVSPDRGAIAEAALSLLEGQLAGAQDAGTPSGRSEPPSTDGSPPAVPFALVVRESTRGWAGRASGDGAESIGRR